jgi:hypothetical protein
MSAAYPHLHALPGVDLTHENPQLLARLEKLGAKLGRTLTITSGYRSYAKQKYLWDNAARLGLVRGKTVAAPGGSLHQGGLAADVTIGGVMLQNVPGASAAARSVGLYPLAGDAPHVQLVPGGTSFAAATKKYGGVPLAEKFTPYNGPQNIPDVAAGGVAGHITDPSTLVVQGIAAALGTDGPRFLVYAALIIGGAALIIAGLARATGLDKHAGAVLATTAKAVIK